MKLRIIGNSHVGCLKHGLEAIPLYGEHDIKVSGFISGKEQRGSSFHQIKDWTIELTRGSHLVRFVEVMGSSQLDRDAVYGVCMFPYLDHLYTQDNPTDDFDEDSGSVLAFLRDLQASGFKVIPIMMPGPHGGNGRIRCGVSQALHIDKAYREYLRDAFAGMGLKWIEAHPDAHDEIGFLKPEYVKGKPPDHGNTTYGVMMMKTILQETGGLLAHP